MYPMNRIPGIIIVDGMNRNDSESVEVLVWSPET